MDFNDSDRGNKVEKMLFQHCRKSYEVRWETVCEWKNLSCFIGSAWGLNWKSINLNNCSIGKNSIELQNNLCKSSEIYFEAYCESLFSHIELSR